jgi:hypothetical protein
MKRAGEANMRREKKDAENGGKKKKKMTKETKEISI